MVLYQVPSSLTVPEGQDSVRRAIIEARTRARDRRATDTDIEIHAATNGAGSGPALRTDLATRNTVATVHEDDHCVNPPDDDIDAMDIDEGDS
jgi:hypothetical protein